MLRPYIVDHRRSSLIIVDDRRPSSIIVDHRYPVAGHNTPPRPAPPRPPESPPTAASAAASRMDARLRDCSSFARIFLIRGATTPPKLRATGSGGTTIGYLLKLSAGTRCRPLEPVIFCMAVVHEALDQDWLSCVRSARRIPLCHTRGSKVRELLGTLSSPSSTLPTWSSWAIMLSAVRIVRREPSLELVRWTAASFRSMGTDGLGGSAVARMMVRMMTVS